MAIIAPKGTKDTLPEQVYRWHYVEKKFSETAARYGFKEIRTPIFEHTELFKRGVGDTTDIVQKEMYTFEDYGHRSLTLKPEGTASAARAFIEHKTFAEVQPTKYYYITPCFRYEKPQSGRLRAFHQFGIEIFGTNDMLADAETICLGYDFLKEMGITGIKLKINSVGCPTCRAKHREALKSFLQPEYDKLCNTCKDRYERNPMRILDCKSEICQEIVKDAPNMIDFLCDDCQNAFDQLTSNLEAMGIEYIIDPRIVRGLDYYTKTAFEFVKETNGTQGTVCGGGRYDHLIEEIGGPSVPGVGFGLGIERLLMLMDEEGIQIPEPEKTKAFIAVMGDNAKAFGLKLLRDLRLKGISAEMDILARNIKGQFKYANRIGARYTVVIGDNELEAGVVSIKDMATSQQREVKLEELLEELSK